VQNEPNFGGSVGGGESPLFHYSTIPIRWRLCETNPISPPAQKGNPQNKTPTTKVPGRTENRPSCIGIEDGTATFRLLSWASNKPNFPRPGAGGGGNRAKRTQLGPAGRGVPGRAVRCGVAGARSGRSAMPVSDFELQTSHFPTETVQNKAKLGRTGLCR
jgi:hypothetical protein